MQSEYKPRNLPEEDAALLLKRFNDRENSAFGEVYRLFYDELHYFSSRLYGEGHPAATDAIHDAFLNLWRTRNLFEGLGNVKAYILVSLRNGYRNFVRKERSVPVFDDDYYVTQAIEAEVFSLLPEALGMLPAECARILRMFLEGMDAHEIARFTGKRESTVYNQRNRAIAILKKKLSKDKLLIITALLGGIN